jgi:hypothetical protein
MKIGKNLEQMKAEIVRQRDQQHDFKASPAALSLNERMHLRVGKKGEFPVNDLCHGQIADYVDIPSKYYKRMRAEQPELLARNVNTWLATKDREDLRLVRTLDGKARSFSSSKYRRLDNYDLANVVFPIIEDVLKLQVVSAELTETRMYIKAVHPSIERNIPKGAMMGDGGHTIFDTVAPAVFLGNSEVGFGSLFIERGTLTRACTNLALFPGAGMRRYHIGKKSEMDGEDLADLLSNETKELDQLATFSKVRDVLMAAFDEPEFDKMVGIIKSSTERKIGDDIDIDDVIEVVADKYDMPSATRAAVLKHLVTGGSLSQYALANAVTRAAEDVTDYDVASDMEKAGGEIMMLSDDGWTNLQNPKKAAKEKVAA